MRKLIVLLLGIILITGCTLFNDDALVVVKSYLGKFNHLDEVIVMELDNFLDSQDLSDTQRDIYNEVIENQYRGLLYEIVEVEYDGDEAVVEVNIEVNDLYIAQKEAMDYLDNNYEDFLDDNGEYNESLFLTYKLNKMLEQDDKVDYTLDIELSKTDDGNWYVVQLSDDELEKIHGVYNYGS